MRSSTHHRVVMMASICPMTVVSGKTNRVFGFYFRVIRKTAENSSTAMGRIENAEG